MHFNPRGPCGPRLFRLAVEFNVSHISILAVLADRDQNGFDKVHTVKAISILAVLADRDT